MLIPIIEELASKESVIFNDGFKSYDGIENFWGLCKVRLTKFRGIKKNNFYLHIKECEFRFNNRDNNIYKMLLKSFRNKTLKLA